MRKAILFSPLITRTIITIIMILTQACCAVDCDLLINKLQTSVEALNNNKDDDAIRLITQVIVSLNEAVGIRVKSVHIFD